MGGLGDVEARKGEHSQATIFGKCGNVNSSGPHKKTSARCWRGLATLVDTVKMDDGHLAISLRGPSLLLPGRVLNSLEDPLHMAHF